MKKYDAPAKMKHVGHMAYNHNLQASSSVGDGGTGQTTHQSKMVGSTNVGPAKRHIVATPARKPVKG